MYRQMLLVLVGICAVVIGSLTSCVTTGTPSLPKPHSGNDTLLVVPIGRAEGSVTALYGNLRFTYEALASTDSEPEEQGFFAASPAARSTKLYAQYPRFGIVRYLRPGRYTIEAVRFVSEEHGHFGKRHNLQNIEFTVESGAITVLPFRFIVDYTKPIKVFKSADYYVFDIDTDVVAIQKLDEEEIALLWKEVGSYNNVDLWKGR
jgi:hypothetical protein